MDKFADIPRHTTKKTGAYKDYLMQLKDYLVSFMERTRPMYDLDKEFSKVGFNVQIHNIIFSALRMSIKVSKMGLFLGGVLIKLLALRYQLIYLYISSYFSLRLLICLRIIALKN